MESNITFNFIWQTPNGSMFYKKTLSHILTKTTLNSRGTIISYNTFHNVVLRMMLKHFIKATKNYRDQNLLLQYSSTMILKVTRWSTVQ